MRCCIYTCNGLFLVIIDAGRGGWMEEEGLLPQDIQLYRIRITLIIFCSLNIYTNEIVSICKRKGCK